MKKKSKIRVGIVFGGRSSEHEISLLSARSIINAIDRSKYDVSLIGIGKNGRWLRTAEASYLLHAGDPKRIALNVSAAKELALAPGGGGVGPVDIVFPVLHGPYGEDGSVQGLLRMLDVPFVGPDVLGSAIGMDKDVTKRLLRAAGLPVTDFLAFKRGEVIPFARLWKRLGRPLFVKPANQGSSVGINKARNERELKTAVAEAFLYDDKILIERAVPGHEIQVSVLGNEIPEASVPGEIIPHHEFYSYEAKYLGEKGTVIQVPARISASATRRVRALAVAAFKALELEGMARVDFFMTRQGKFLVSEVNTIPGFTAVSMYPKLWAASGLPYPELIDRLIALGLARHARRSRLESGR